MQGTIIVVMFPHTWGTYRSLVQEDRVIAVKGKGDLRNDEVQVIADEVTQNVTTAQADIPEYAPTDALAALRATVFLDGAPDDDPDDETDQTGDIYIPQDEDIPPLAEDEWHGEPLVTQAPPPPLDPVRSSNGGTNGHQAAASHDAPTQDTTELDGRQRLIVTLSRTGDNDVDTNRLRTIYNIAGSHPGEDELCIHVRQPQYNNVAVVRFPARGINVCEALFHDLSRAHIDEGDIQVETY
jgi:hypothetical protein